MYATTPVRYVAVTRQLGDQHLLGQRVRRSHLRGRRRRFANAGVSIWQVDVAAELTTTFGPKASEEEYSEEIRRPV
ncbi:hypothetical protein [Gemmatimonas sp.]|uniref:hypothetical protein n=1 Tax=Gemmatimonas sp. TaxID=1962908 RepID=UPI00286E2751|nr:hypothetical protein [Gemmatimonas sp.]